MVMLLIALVGGGDTACGTALGYEKANGSVNEKSGRTEAMSGVLGVLLGSGSRLNVNPDSAGDVSGSFSMRILDTVVVPAGLGNTLVAVDVELGNVSRSRMRESSELAGEWC